VYGDYLLRKVGSNFASEGGGGGGGGKYA